MKSTINLSAFAAMLAFLCWTICSCTKEGLPGPQGPVGPAGQDGSGIGGADTRVISYEFGSDDFTWEETGTVSYYKQYRLTYALPTHAGYTFTLPDSVTRYIEEGACLVFMHIPNNYAPTWRQLGFLPPNFYDYEGYGYTAQKIPGVGYRYTIIAFDIPYPDEYIPVAIRFVVIPKTSAGDLLGH